MKIKVLGTRGEIEPALPYHRYHSGVLVDGAIMFDVGEKKFLNYSPKYIFITHLHPDHAFFVRRASEVGVPTFAPEPYGKVKGVNVLSEEIAVDSYKILPVPTHHAKVVKSQAYILSKGDQKILYTGDLVWIKKEYHHLFEHLSLVITDGSIIRKGGRILRDRETGQIFGHAGIPDLIKLFKEFTRNILFIHFGSWFYEGVKEARETLDNLAGENSINIITGYDGMEIDVSHLNDSG